VVPEVVGAALPGVVNCYLVGGNGRVGRAVWIPARFRDRCAKCVHSVPLASLATYDEGAFGWPILEVVPLTVGTALPGVVNRCLTDRNSWMGAAESCPRIDVDGCPACDSICLASLDAHNEGAFGWSAR
jgi:hypothetical protein